MKSYDADTPRRGPDLSHEVDADALAETWERLGEVDVSAVDSGEAVDAAWDRLSARLFAEGGAQASSGSAAPGPLRRLPRAPWMRVAASVALLMVGGAGAWSVVPAKAAAGAGEQVRIVLPGGTAVDLNAGSTLRWARGFAWLPGIERSERRVRLEGEAFFDVVADGRPFRVETSHARVRVLGTRFNVRAWDDEGTSVTVDEGSVEVREMGVADAAAAGAVVLTAGQRVTAGRGAFEVVDVESAPAQAWRTGGFAVTDGRVSAILAELERRFSVRIETDGLPAPVLDRRLTLYYSAPVRIEGVLDDVVTTLGLRYREVAGGWEVVPSP